MLGWATNAKQMSTASKKLLSLRGVIFVMRNYFFPRHLVEGRHLLVQMWTTRPVRNWGAGSRHLNNYEINRHQCILQSEQHNKAVLRSRAFFPRLADFFSRLRLRVKNRLQLLTENLSSGSKQLEKICLNSAPDLYTQH